MMRLGMELGLSHRNQQSPLGPIPPAGLLFLVDAAGAYLLDADGAYLVTPA